MRDFQLPLVMPVQGLGFCPPGYVITGMTGSTRVGGPNVEDPCRWYWNCRKLDDETPGSIWDVDYLYPEWEL